MIRRSAVLFFGCIAFLATTAHAASIDIQKLRVRGAQHIKDLKYFLDTDLLSAQKTQIEMQIENFERALVSYRVAKPTERNLALRAAQTQYEKLSSQFKSVAEIFRDLVERYQTKYNENSSDPIADTPLRERVTATIEVGKQDEGRALAAFNNRNFVYAAHIYLRSLKHYAQAFELRKWPQLAKVPLQEKSKKHKQSNRQQPSVP